MSLKTRISILLIAVNFSGCVTFNDVTRPNIDTSKEICSDIYFKSIENDDGTLKEKDLDDPTKIKVLRVLSTYNIKTECGKKTNRIEIKMFGKISAIREGLTGFWSIFTVLSLGIIPLYSDYEVELSYSDELSPEATSTTYNHNTVVWLPFAYKQLKQDSYAYDNFGVDARSSILGSEIAKLIRSKTK